MAGFRVLLGFIVVLWVQPTAAVEFWAPADCEVYMLDHVERLDEYVTEIGELLVLLDEAERKGEAERAETFRRSIASKRVDGIQSMLKRIDTVEYVYCDKTLIDPSVIARVDAARPYAEDTGPTLSEVEEPVDLRVASVTSTFVPYETIAGGGCRGPFIDLAVTIVNDGGTFPRPVDLEKREREYPGSNLPYFSVNLEFDWNNGVAGAQQVITVDKGMLSGGTLPMGGTVTLPLRVAVGNNQTAVTVKPMIAAGSLLQISGDKLQTDRVPFDFDIPIWDVYTYQVGVVSFYDREDKRILKGAIRATLQNLGQSPLPGEVEGNFAVRQRPDGPRVLIVGGRSLNGTMQIVAGNEIRTPIKGKTYVESGLTLLCPDGSYGQLSDGNIENNTRVLQGQE